MKIKFKIYPIIFLGLFGLSLTQSCYYDVEEVLYPSDTCDTMATFQAVVLPLFESSCNQCHATDLSFGGITLDNYSDVKATLSSGRLLGAIRHESGFSPMPQGNPKFSDCNIKKIEAWVNAGALNN